MFSDKTKKPHGFKGREAFPTFKVGATFIRAGFLTNNFDAGQTFIFPDFRDMYNRRKSVVSYLEKQLNAQDEILVLGQDPNIYLELEHRVIYVTSETDK